jgi:hypothetical protein
VGQPKKKDAASIGARRKDLSSNEDSNGNDKIQFQWQNSISIALSISTKTKNYSTRG